MKRLILNQIPEDFDPAKDTVISAASYLGHENELNGDFHKIFETYHGHKSKKQAAREATHIAYYHLPFLTEHFNKKYKTNEDQQFWKAVIFPWLLTFTHILLDRYYRAYYFVENHKDETFSIEILEKEGRLQLEESDDLFTLIQNHDFNHWLYSIFMKTMVPVHWNSITVKKNILAPRKLPVAQLSFRNKLSNWVKKKLRVSYVYGFSAQDCLLFTLKLWFLPKKKAAKQALNIHENETMDVPTFFKSEEFKKLLLEFSPLEFSQVPSLLKERMQLCRGKIRLLGPIFYSDLYYKVLAARAAKAGEIVLTTQHGGGYGLYDVIDYPHELETQFHGFISWGWESNASFPGKVIPLASPFLSGVENSYVKKTNDIILVGTKCNPYADRIEFSFEPSTMLRYRDAKRLFIQGLSPEKKQDFYYRPYPQADAYFEDFSYQKRFDPGLKLLEGNFHQKMKECRLLVLDHAQTTLNLALAANAPTVCLLLSEDWDIADSAVESMNDLRRVGIIHSDPLELANFINNENIEDWWLSDKVQAARKDWLYIHGRVSSNWKHEWWQFLSSL